MLDRPGRGAASPGRRQAISPNLLRLRQHYLSREPSSASYAADDRSGHLSQKVGFEDIAAKSETVRVVLIVQILGDLVVLGAGVRELLGAVRRAGRSRRWLASGASHPSRGMAAAGVTRLYGYVHRGHSVWCMTGSGVTPLRLGGWHGGKR